MISSLPAEDVCIVGTGYVGMASAIGFAELGHRVRGYDIVTERVHGLQRGVTPYREDGIEEALRRHLVHDAVRFCDDLAVAVDGARFVVIAVGTPSLANGEADLTAVEAAIASLEGLLAPEAIIVLRSTVPAGTSERLARRLSNPLVFAPEFLREGCALADFLNPDRIVIGVAPEEASNAATAYANLLAALERPLVVTSLREAELIKCFSNAFLALKVSFANEVANVADALDADALAVLNGIGRDSRIGTAFLAPGIGFGGPCFEKDVRSLQYVASALGSSRQLLEATLRVNEAQPRRVVDILEEELGGLRGAHVGVWGLTFKAGTDDVRNSLALRVVEDLLARGAGLLAYDPAVRGERADVPCALASSALGAIEQADALLVLTEWPEFAQISPWAIASRLRRRTVVDGRNVLDMDALATTGVRYRGIGRKALPDAAGFEAEAVV